MEKLKVTHDHSLTDILKVLIFTLVLLIPGFMFLPSILYFGFNEQANAPTKQVEIKENIEVNFSQLERNGNFSSYDNWNGVRLDLNISNNIATLTPNQTASNNNFAQNPTNGLAINHKFLAYATYKTFAVNEMVFQVYSNTTTQSFMSNVANEWDYAYLFFDVTANTTYNIRLYNQSTNTSNIAYFKNSMIVDLTQLYGAGNEITNFSDYIGVFNAEYYDYTTSKIMLIEGATVGTETVVEITNQLEYNWEQIWQKPLLSWTNRSILKNGLDNFTQVFGITNTSYITNLLTYELIMVGVYIVIDIVLTLFKWLTHMIGNK